MSTTRLESSGSTPVPAATTVLGVVGGIASGKSLVARLLAGPDGIVVSADEYVDRMYADRAFCARVARDFGPGVLRADGTVDRAALGRMVFADPAQRKRLEGWIHPSVREQIRARLAEARASGVPRVVLDVPLLLENDAEHHLAGACSTLVFVGSKRALREARAAQRGWQPGELQRREAAQLALDEKRRRTDCAIENNGTLQELEQEVKRLLRTLALR